MSSHVSPNTPVFSWRSVLRPHFSPSTPVQQLTNRNPSSLLKYPILILLLITCIKLASNVIVIILELLHAKKIYFVIILLGILGMAQTFAKINAKSKHLKTAKFSGCVGLR